jgi:hypothetical protein
MAITVLISTSAQVPSANALAQSGHVTALIKRALWEQSEGGARVDGAGPIGQDRMGRDPHCLIATTSSVIFAVPIDPIGIVMSRVSMWSSLPLTQ